MIIFLTLVDDLIKIIIIDWKAFCLGKTILITTQDIFRFISRHRKYNLGLDRLSNQDVF